MACASAVSSVCLSAPPWHRVLRVLQGPVVFLYSPMCLSALPCPLCASGRRHVPVCSALSHVTLSPRFLQAEPCPCVCHHPTVSLEACHGHMCFRAEMCPPCAPHPVDSTCLTAVLSPMSPGLPHGPATSPGYHMYLRSLPCPPVPLCTSDGCHVPGPPLHTPCSPVDATYQRCPPCPQGSHHHHGASGSLPTIPGTLPKPGTSCVTTTSLGVVGPPASVCW